MKKNETIEHIDLALLIYPEAHKKHEETYKTHPGYTPWGQLNATEQITFATKFFNDGNDSDNDKKRKRNEIQDRLMLESERLCAEFKKVMYDLRSHSELTLGGASTITGVLGSIFTKASTVRALAGASGILSGLNAEYQQTRFQNLASQVIVDGIEARRTQLREVIDDQAQPKDIGNYSLAAAVRDVTIYHSQCHVITGFQVAHESIRLVENPGLEQAAKAIKNVAVLTAIQNAGETDDLDKLIEIMNKSKKNKLLTFSNEDKESGNLVAFDYQPQMVLEAEAQAAKDHINSFVNSIEELAVNSDKIPQDADEAKSKKDEIETVRDKLKEAAKNLKLVDAATQTKVTRAQEAVFDDLAALDKAEKSKRDAAKLKFDNSRSAAGLVAIELTEHADKVKSKVTEAMKAFTKAIDDASKDPAKIDAAVGTATTAIDAAVSPLDKLETKI